MCEGEIFYLVFDLYYIIIELHILFYVKIHSSEYLFKM